MKPLRWRGRGFNHEKKRTCGRCQRKITHKYKRRPGATLRHAILLPPTAFSRSDPELAGKSQQNNGFMSKQFRLDGVLHNCSRRRETSEIRDVQRNNSVAFANTFGKLISSQGHGVGMLSGILPRKNLWLIQPRSLRALNTSRLNLIL